MNNMKTIRKMDYKINEKKSSKSKSKSTNKKKLQTIVNFKLMKKRQNFSFKHDLKVNLVSSLKPKIKKELNISAEKKLLN